MNQFRRISISGRPFERGEAHGEQLRSEIAETIVFYRSIFELPEAQILRLADAFREKIEAFEPAYIDEINGIAQGANVDPLWIVALNARTEILSRNRRASQECTSVYFGKPAILGQNWDWGRPPGL